MAVTNHERIGKAIDLLTKGLRPFVMRRLQGVYRAKWKEAIPLPPGQRHASKPTEEPHLDAQALLSLIWDEWNRVFRSIIGPAERSLVSELRDVRNRWAHQRAFSNDDAYRALDSMQRLLKAIDAPQAASVDDLRHEVLGELSVRDQERVRVGGNADKVLTYLTGIAPDWASNSDIRKKTAIEPHQQVFQLTQRLLTAGRVQGERRGREWYFRMLEPNSSKGQSWQ